MAVHKDMIAQMQTNATIGASISRVFPVEMLKQRPGSRQLLGNILFDMLRYLDGIGEKALANSIWHSIRVDFINRDRGHGQPLEPIDTPDDVTDLLNDQDMISDPWKTLQLDHSNSTISETWLINRIMEDGLLWAGNCTTSGMPVTEGNETFRGSSIARRQRSLRFLGLMSENVMGPETKPDLRTCLAFRVRRRRVCWLRLMFTGRVRFLRRMIVIWRVFLDLRFGVGVCVRLLSQLTLGLGEIALSMNSLISKERDELRMRTRRRSCDSANQTSSVYWAERKECGTFWNHTARIINLFNGLQCCSICSETNGKIGDHKSYKRVNQSNPNLCFHPISRYSWSFSNPACKLLDRNNKKQKILNISIKQ